MRRAAAVLLGCLLLVGCGEGAAPVATGGAVARPDAVPQDGDTVTGSGRLVQEPGGQVLFCGNENTADIGYAPGQEPAPVACRDGIPLEGADLTVVAERFEKAGAVEGFATITGTWRGGTVEVQEQGSRAEPGERVFEGVPCPAPAGGWPVTSESDNMTAEMARVHQSGRVLVGPNRFALLRPSKDQVLLGYAVPDEASRVQAQAVLDELVPGRACVVVARHTDAQVEAARAVDWSGFGGVRGYGVGLRQMQAVLHVHVLLVTEPMAAEAARHPEGLVELTPDLRVVTVNDRLDESPAPAEPEEPEVVRTPGVPEQGDRVTAVGTVRRVEGEPDRLCHPDQAYPAILLPPGETLPCLGIDLDGLAGLSEGLARITGTWTGDAVAVEEVGPGEPSQGHAGLPEVPCPAPAGGWPDGGAPYDDRSPDDAAISRYGEAHPELSATGRLMLLRPAPDRQVVTVVVRDEAERARVEAELAPDFPGRTCVVVQEHDVEAASGVQDDPRLTQESLMVSSSPEWGPGLRTRKAVALVLRLTPLLLEAERDADGLLELRPMLTVAD